MEKSQDQAINKTKTEDVAREFRVNDPKGQKGNGNNYELDETKRGGAQSGGPGIDRARERQPPDATRAKSDSKRS